MEPETVFICYVNGKLVTCADVNPRWSLLWYIRNKLFLTGSKVSCGSGACGACTVMISEKDRYSTIKHYAVNACVYPLVLAHGKAVTTVEGIGSTRISLHPIQERLAKCHGTQCGFCSPGMVMSMYSLMRNTSQPTHHQIEQAITGNLCRCTGYRPIIQSFKTFSDDACPLGENCCKNQSVETKDTDVGKPAELVYYTTIFKPLDPTQDLIFPNELQLSESCHLRNVAFGMADDKWYQPANIVNALRLKKSLPESRWAMGHLVTAGNGCTISVGHLQELNGVYVEKAHLCIGAATSLSDLHESLLAFTTEDESSLKTVREGLMFTLQHWKSGQQIKNMATIGGNIFLGNKTSTFIPLLMMLKAKLRFVTLNEEEKTKVETYELSSEFLKEVGQNSLLTVIKIPIQTVSETEFLGVYYAEQQTHLIGRSASVQCVFQAKVTAADQLVSLSLVLAGLHHYPQMYHNVLNSKAWDETLQKFVKQWFEENIKPEDELDSYVAQTSQNFFTKFYTDVQKRRTSGGGGWGFVTSDCQSEVWRSVHVWEPPNKTKSVGQPLMTQWALEHATGEAKYCMDMAHFQEELFLSLVTSTKAHAKIISVDPTPAFSVPGVVDYISHKDIPGENSINKQEIFVTEKVTAVGNVIGAIVALSEEAAKKGAASVLVKYEDLPAIMTIQEALEQGSFLGPDIVIDHGNIEKGLKSSWKVLQGEVELGGQEHFYMETQSTIVIPKQEYSQYDVYAATQNPDAVQSEVANALGVDNSRVTVHIRRLGGAFGGKTDGASLVTLPVAVAAHKHNKPIRIALERGQDMQITGGRHPAFIKYQVGFTEDGKLQALDCEISLNGGDRNHLSGEVLEVACLFVDCAYCVPNLRIVGHACRTNTVSNTAFRGFGAPQSSMVMHLCMEQIADHLNVDTTKIQELNFYKDGDMTHLKQTMKHCTVTKCYEMLMKQSNYLKQREEVREFNQQSIWVKRGISIVPVKQGMSFPLRCFNQGYALVTIYKDGSVLLHHGGVEVGQGLNIKMIQIAAETLGIPQDRVIISEMTTDVTPNSTVSAASVTSDLVGGAVKNACDELNDRLGPIKSAKPSSTWEELITAAYKDRVSLSVAGHYSTPNMSKNEKTEEINFNYFTFGIGCSLIELDVLTGEHTLLSTDIVFDVGNSLNPAIDIGQIEGGFLQGYGYYCLEEMLYNDDGVLLNKGSSYRVPTVRDIPQALNVTLLKDVPNKRAVYSSKGIGEPPLLLAASVYMAIRDAIKSVRRDKGFVEDFQLNIPASPRRVLHACTSE